MGRMEDGLIDLTITSPPYNVDIQYDGYNDKMPFLEYEAFCEDWLSTLFRKTKNGGRLCLNINNTVKDFENDKLLSACVFFTNIAEKYGWTFREHITWIKMKDEDGEIFAGGKTAWGSWMSASNPQLRSFTEPILVFHKGSPKKEPVGESDITKEEFMQWTKNAWYIMPDKDNTHPAVFPKDIPYRCMKIYSYIGDLIYEPFTGSGTTIDACRELKRNFIGSEISNQYYKYATDRLSQSLLF